MRRSIFALFVVVAAIAAQGAYASSIVSTSNETFISIGVNSKGEAIVKYKDAGGTHETLAYGAENAIAPSASGKQVDFTWDYSGGQTLFKNDLAKAVKQLRDDQNKFKAAQAAAAKGTVKYTPAVLKYSAAIKVDNQAIAKLHGQANDYDKTFTCPKYTGPKLAFFVGGCTAPDGSFWAVQQWDRALPDYGVTPTEKQKAMELHLSHWTGDLPVLTVEADWSYHKWEHFFGTYTYAGSPVYGFHSTAAGQPLDSFGRNVYLDSYGSDYPGGAGTWMRVNSYLTHKPTGAWCYGVSPHPTPASPTGAGSQYRFTIQGPGVTPDVSVTVNSPGPYNAALDATQNQKINALNDGLCKAN